MADNEHNRKRRKTEKEGDDKEEGFAEEEEEQEEEDGEDEEEEEDQFEHGYSQSSFEDEDETFNYSQDNPDPTHFRGREGVYATPRHDAYGQPMSTVVPRYGSAAAGGGNNGDGDEAGDNMVISLPKIHRIHDKVHGEVLLPLLDPTVTAAAATITTTATITTAAAMPRTRLGSSLSSSKLWTPVSSNGFVSSSNSAAR